MAGRGAWPANGRGGTWNYAGTAPGAYYRLPKTGTAYAGIGADNDRDAWVVNRAVRAIQRALNRRLATPDLKVDGIYGPTTASAVSLFQDQRDLSIWGGVGPDTARVLLWPDLTAAVRARRKLLTTNDSALEISAAIICGVIKRESLWDPGAVGFLDETDIGLGQINGPSHSDITDAQRMSPKFVFGFIFDKLKAAVDDPTLVTIDDAIASYNLGIGGARRWIGQGRPELYTPSGATRPRNVLEYIEGIKTGCAT